MTDSSSKISALIPTFNNEKIIRQCLKSVQWADEILAVDSYSTCTSASAGQIGTLRHRIKHCSMPTITKQLEHLDRYSRYQADELHRLGKHFRWYQLVLRPFMIFSYLYWWKRGFMVGSRGLLVAAVATAFDFWSYAKLWEIQAEGLQKSPN